jgi:hypothetical protein
MKKLSLITTVFLLFSLTLSGQVVEGRKSFPTRLSLRPTNSSIQIDWRLAETEVSGYHVYRSAVPIDPLSFDKAEKIASVSADTSGYEDFPPYDSVPYFYAVLAVDLRGEEQQLFIPFSNVNLYGVNVLYTQQAMTESAVVSGIKVEAVPPEVIIRFSADKTNRELLVYRHTSPIEGTSDLIRGTLIGRISSGAGLFRDRPISGVSYYYAVLDSLNLLSGDVYLVSGINSTNSAVALPFRDRGGPVLPSDFSLRPRPLPYLSADQLYRENNGQPVPVSAVAVSEETQNRIANLLSRLEGRRDRIMMPVLLEEDRKDTLDGADQKLKIIVDEELIPGHWETAKTLLDNFTRLPQPAGVERRAHFYKGQASYFLGDYRNALVNFIFAEKYYHAESQPWIWMTIRKLRD